jgi:hypothetical protein
MLKLLQPVRGLHGPIFVVTWWKLVLPLDGTYNCCTTCWQLNSTTRTSCATCSLVARPEPNILTCQKVGMWQNLLYNLCVGGWKVVQHVVELLWRVRWWCTTCCTTCSCSGVWPLAVLKSFRRLLRQGTRMEQTTVTSHRTVSDTTTQSTPFDHHETPPVFTHQ